MITGVATAKACWDSLHDQFHGKGKQHIANLMEKLCHYTISETKAIEPQILTMLKATCNLDSLGFSLSDKTLAFMIVMALPHSMSTLKSILYDMPGPKLSSSGIIAKILEDEQE